MSTCYDNSNSDELQLYPIRWFFLAVAAMLFLLYSFSGMSITQINNIFVLYFHVSYAVVDWGAIGSFAGSLLAAMPVAWLTYTKYLQFRRLVITSAGLLCLSFAIGMAAFADTKLFPLLVIGQFLNGVCVALHFPMSLALTMAWFPHKEVGTALGVFLFGGSAGLMLGTLVPSQVVMQPPVNATSRNTIWRRVDFEACLVMWGIPLAICFVLLILMVGLAADYPPKPPTLVQKEKRKNPDMQSSFQDFLRTCKNLLKDINCLIVFIAGSIIYHVNTGEYTIMTQLMTKVLRGSNYDVDIMSSYSTTLMSAGGVIGSLVGGKIVNMSKRYKVQVIVMALLATLTSGLVLTAYHYNSYQAMFAMNVVFGFSTRSYTVSLFEILTQTTYPINESFVMTIFNATGCFVTIIVAELGRLVYNNSGGFWMLTFQTGFAFIGLLLTITISNSNERFDAETMLRGDAQESREDTNLLHES